MSLWTKGLKPSSQDGLTAGICYSGMEGRKAIWSPLAKAHPDLTEPLHYTSEIDSMYVTPALVIKSWGT